MKVYIGIDWSENKHDVCFLDEMEEVLLVKQIPHTIAGFRQLDQACQSLGVGGQEVIIGLETAHNLLVGVCAFFRQFAWLRVYTTPKCYHIPPQQITRAVGHRWVGRTYSR